MRIDANKQGPPGYIEVLLNVENDHQIHKDIYKKKQGPPGYVAVFTVDNDWQIHEDIDKDKKRPTWQSRSSHRCRTGLLACSCKVVYAINS